MTTETTQEPISEEEEKAPLYDKKHVIGRRIMKLRQSKSGNTIFQKIRIGDLVAIRVGDKVSIGWSLLNKKDVYDFIEGNHEPGFGRRTAINRAIKWLDRRVIEVPPSISKKAKKFAERCQSYYKGLEVPFIRSMVVKYPRNQKTNTTEE